jgi:hypothetical protein
MALSDVFSWLNPNKRRADRARQELMENAEKALRMKQEADTGTHVPPHQTAHEGMQPAPEPEAHNRTPGGDPKFIPELKRSRVARSGDAS